METLHMLEILNAFIEEERAECLKSEGIRDTALEEFRDVKADELIALIRILGRDLVTEPDISMPDQYEKFQEAVVQGEIDILELTEKQKLYFLIFLQDKELQKKMIWAAADAEERLLEMRKHLPDAASVLEIADLSGKKIFQKAKMFAEAYLAIARRVLTYHKYVKLYRIFYKKEGDEK